MTEDTGTGYTDTELWEEIARLREFGEHYSGAAQDAWDRIEVLEKALREIAELPEVRAIGRFSDGALGTAPVRIREAQTIARDVLAAGMGAHPEAICVRCSGTNPVWTAPSPLWNKVMRGGDINGAEIHGGIVCPSCFANLATEGGVADGWRLTAETVHVPLQDTTPSGRTWNPETWLWDDVAAAAPVSTEPAP